MYTCDLDDGDVVMQKLKRALDEKKICYKDTGWVAPSCLFHDS